MNENTTYFDEDELEIDYHQITEKIYLGNGSTSFSLKTLKEHKITHILICAIDFYEVFPKEFVYKKIPLMDNLVENISQYFEETFTFIEEADKIYLHCQAGISRSVAILISYLMKKEKLNVREAFKFIKNKRNCVKIKNSNYLRQLEEYEKKIL